MLNTWKKKQFMTVSWRCKLVNKFLPWFTNAQMECRVQKKDFFLHSIRMKLVFYVNFTYYYFNFNNFFEMLFEWYHSWIESTTNTCKLMFFTCRVFIAPSKPQIYFLLTNLQLHCNFYIHFVDHVCYFIKIDCKRFLNKQGQKTICIWTFSSIDLKLFFSLSQIVCEYLKQTQDICTKQTIKIHNFKRNGQNKTWQK